MRLLLIVLLSGVNVCFGQQIERLVMAESQLLVGDTTGSTIIFREVLEKYPDSYVAALRLAEIQYQRQIFNESIQYSTIAEDILIRKLDSLDINKPMGDDSLKWQTYLEDYSELHLLRGKIRMRQLRFPDAEGEFRKAIKNAPNPSIVYQNIGVALINQGNEDEAISQFQEAIAQNPANTAAMMNLGNIYYSRKEFVSASFFFIRATEVDPTITDAYNYLGAIATMQGDYQAALEAYSAFLEFEQTEEIYFKRAVILAELLKWDASIDDWDNVISINPDNHEAFRNRGLCYFQLQDFKSAVSDFTHALLLKPEPYTYINRGYCFYLMDEPRQALEDINYGLSELPEYRLGYYFRGLTYRRLHKKKKACTDLQKAMELGMEESEIDREFLADCL